MRRSAAVTALCLWTCVLAWPQALVQPANAPSVNTGVLWKDPGNIKSLDLLDGPGGKNNHPRLPVEFLKEDPKGTSPKFDVRDERGEKWRAKLGPEARPETVASRLLWAMGYSANENYFFSQLQVRNLPAQLHRGQSFVSTNGEVQAVRLQRRVGGEKKEGTWSWRDNPFLSTREFNGLRVMMALINNWDLKDENNAIYDDAVRPGRQLYEVSDIGASFGRNAKSYTDKGSKGNLEAYAHSKFISKITPEYVTFNSPGKPPWIQFLFAHRFYHRAQQLRWIAKKIPRADVKWIAGLLAQLTPDQIRDAFRAADYTPQQVEAFANAVAARIEELKNL